MKKMFTIKNAAKAVMAVSAQLDEVLRLMKGNSYNNFLFKDRDWSSKAFYFIYYTRTRGGNNYNNLYEAF
jgi:hypothetical protein